MRFNVPQGLRSCCALLTLTAFCLIPNGSFAQEAKPDESMKTAEQLLKRAPRPKRPELSPSTLPLSFIQGERVALIGNSTAERMNLFGHFETLLHLRFPAEQLVVRNFARPADEVANRQRANDYYKLDDPLAAFGSDTFFCFFGFNESFAGPDGVEKFKTDYEALLDEFSKKYPRDDAGTPPRFVLVTPLAIETEADAQPRNPLLKPDQQAQLTNIQLYADAVRAVGEKRKLAVVDLFEPSKARFDDEQGLQLTINGYHLNESGDRVIGGILDQKLFGAPHPTRGSSDRLEKLRAAVNDKSWVHLQDYRMLNGWYVYGGRRTWDTETFPREYVKIRNMVAVRDKFVWDIAQGKPTADKPDDSQTGDLFQPQTRFGEPRQKYSENAEGGPTILPPDDLLKTVTVPPGFEMKLFADESKFPEIAKPVQIGFDNKGRLWVSTMPSYPQWQPGSPPPSDKLVILEDRDGDGSADKSTIFYDKLHCPTGFQFFNGGVLVVDQPRLLWLKDTDGDDKADQVVHVLDGWATEDTHHTIGAFESSPSGLIQMMEGVAMSTAVETPWGPFRNFGSSGYYTLDPRTWKITHTVTPGYGNPWCFVYNEWGQGFCGDGTGANQHWDTPLSGQQYRGRKGLNAVFNTESMRPVVGSDFLVTRQFPEDVQGQFIYACVINMNGIPRWTFSDDGAGYKGIRVRHDPNDPKTAFDLLKSTDKHFRPVDPQIGPDGALWFGDWANPLIGHMQYSQRDPNRDHIHGRIYRLYYKDKPLLQPVTQYGKPIPELLDQLLAYEWRTRYRAREELRSRPFADIQVAIGPWLQKHASSAEFDRLRCEALWLQESFHQVDGKLLREALQCKTADARAAATRILANDAEVLGGQAALAEQAKDPNARVRTEAIRGLSFYDNMEAVQAVMTAAAVEPADNYVQYTADAALGAHVALWRSAHMKGELVSSSSPSKKLLDAILVQDKKAAELVPYLQILLGKDPQPEEQRNKAIQAIADMPGGIVDNGKAFFDVAASLATRSMAKVLTSVPIW